MKLCNSIISVLLLLSTCVSATKWHHDDHGRFLGKKKDDKKHDEKKDDDKKKQEEKQVDELNLLDVDVKDLSTMNVHDIVKVAEKTAREAIKTECPYFVDTFYNVYFTVEDNQDSEATKGCSDDDLIKIGMMIQDIVIDVENEFLKDAAEYANEFISTDVCELPLYKDEVKEFDKEQKVRRRLRRRRRYIYRSGGTCRRCVTLQDRRLLRGGNEEPEFANELCQLAYKTKDTLKGGKKALDDAYDLADYINDKMDDREIEDQAEAQISEILKNMEDIYADIAEDEIHTLDEACLEYDGADEKEAKNLLKDANKAAQTCKEGVAVLQTLHDVVKSVKKALVEEELKENFKKRGREMKDLVDVEKAKLEGQLDELGAKVNVLKDALKESKSLKDAEAMIDLEAELEKVMLEEETMKDKLEAEYKGWKEDVRDEEDYVQTMMHLTFEMQYATNYDDWLAMYVEALTSALPRELMERYGIQAGGCLDEDHDEGFEVVTNLEEVDTKDDTYIDECQFKYPEHDLPAHGVTF